VHALLGGDWLRIPKKSTTCSGHAVHLSERSDAGEIIIHQLVGMDKGESVLRRDSPLRTNHCVQENKQNCQESLKSDEQFVILPGHPFYGQKLCGLIDQQRGRMHAPTER
jgi:hypothetical protein